MALNYSILRSSPVVVLVGAACCTAFCQKLCNDPGLRVSQVFLNVGVKLYRKKAHFLVVKQRYREAVQQVVFLSQHGSHFVYGSNVSSAIYADFVWNVAASLSGQSINRPHHFSSLTYKSVESTSGLTKAQEARRAGGWKSLKKGLETRRAAGYPSLVKGLETRRTGGWQSLKKGNEIRRAAGWKSLVKGRETQRAAGFPNLAKGRETRRAAGFPELKKIRENQRAAGFPNLAKGRETQKAQGWTGNAKGRETYLQNALQTRNAKFNALINSWDINEFLSKPRLSYSGAGKRAAWDKLSKYRNDPAAFDELTAKPRHILLTRYAVWYDADKCPKGVRYEGDGGPEFDVEDYRSRPNPAISLLTQDKLLVTPADVQAFIENLHAVRHYLN